MKLFITVLPLSYNFLVPMVTGLAIISSQLKRFPTTCTIDTMDSELKESTELPVSPPWNLKKRHKENRPTRGLFIIPDLCGLLQGVLQLGLGV